MKQQLEANGWTMYYECFRRCGHKQFFNNPAYPKYEVRVRAKNKTFSILLENRIISGPFYGYQMEEKLKQYIKE